MALVLSGKKTRQIKIIAKEPGDLTASTDHEFTAEFERISTDDWNEMMDSDDDVRSTLKKGIVNIKGIKDESGEKVEYSEALVDSLIEEPWIRTPLFLAQLAMQSGKTQTDLYKKEKRKN